MPRGPRGIALLAVAATLSLGASACGFDDKLTARGFVKAGDGLCDEAAGRAFLALRGQDGTGRPVSQEEAIRVIGDGYASISTGLRKLELTDEDAPMRDAMVERYSAAAAEIEAIAARAGAGDPGARAEAIAVVDGLRPFARTVREYGFQVCGGRAPAS